MSGGVKDMPQSDLGLTLFANANPSREFFRENILEVVPTCAGSPRGPFITHDNLNKRKIKSSLALGEAPGFPESSGSSH